MVNQTAGRSCRATCRPGGSIKHVAWAETAKRDLVDVSIVIAAWRAEAFIGRSIESALAQQGLSLEIIVVDDASDDGTVSAVERVADIRVRLVRQAKNEGPAAARNRGFAAARGRWLAVLDADDSMDPERLSALVTVGDHSAADVVVDNLLAVSETGDAIGPLFDAQQMRLSQLHLTDLFTSTCGSGNSWGYSKPLFRAAFLRNARLLYNSALRNSEDFVLLAECIAMGADVRVVDKTYYLYTRREGSISYRRSAEDIVALSEAIVDFDRRFKLTGPQHAAAEKYLGLLADEAAFLRAVDAAKRGEWLAFCFSLVRRPWATYYLRHAIIKRARMLRDALGS